jgi:hypothetical protein
MVNGNNKVHKMRQEHGLKVQCRELCYVASLCDRCWSQDFTNCQFKEELTVNGKWHNAPLEAFVPTEDPQHSSVDEKIKLCTKVSEHCLLGC